MNIFEEIIKNYSNKPCPICNMLFRIEGVKDNECYSCGNFHTASKHTCFYVDNTKIQLVLNNILIVYNNDYNYNHCIRVSNIDQLGVTILLLSIVIDESKIEPIFPFFSKIISQDKIRTLDLFQ